jgi:hypothetical protein
MGMAVGLSTSPIYGQASALLAALRGLLAPLRDVPAFVRAAPLAKVCSCAPPLIHTRAHTSHSHPRLPR